MALVKEDGTVVEGADSYLSVADADSIIASYGYSDNWASLDTTTKEAHLRNATQEFDYSMDWVSELLEPDTQELLWPREEFTDANGRTVNGITGLVKRSVAQLAGAFADGKTNKEATYLESQSWGDSSETYSKPVKIEDTVYNEVTLRLKRAGYGRSASAVVDIFRA